MDIVTRIKHAIILPIYASGILMLSAGIQEYPADNGGGITLFIIGLLMAGTGYFLFDDGHWSLKIAAYWSFFVGGVNIIDGVVPLLGIESMGGIEWDAPLGEAIGILIAGILIVIIGYYFREESILNGSINRGYGRQPARPSTIHAYQQSGTPSPFYPTPRTPSPTPSPKPSPQPQAKEEDPVVIAMDTLERIIDGLNSSPSLQRIFGVPVDRWLVVLARDNDLRIEDAGEKELSPQDERTYLRILDEVIEAQAQFEQERTELQHQHSGPQAREDARTRMPGSGNLGGLPDISELLGESSQKTVSFNKDARARSIGDRKTISFSEFDKMKKVE